VRRPRPASRAHRSTLPRRLAQRAIDTPSRLISGMLCPDRETVARVRTRRLPRRRRSSRTRQDGFERRIGRVLALPLWGARNSSVVLPGEFLRVRPSNGCERRLKIRGDGEQPRRQDDDCVGASRGSGLPRATPRVARVLRSSGQGRCAVR
jgi:hypothetical protein